MLKKSVRIQLFDNEGMVSDRLVTQTTEFYMGPKEVHKGPMRIEFTFEEQKDVEEAITYLQKLRGELPIGSSKPRGRTPSTSVNDDYMGEQDKNQILADVVSKSKDQDQFINTLREMGFVFMTSDYLKHFIPEAYDIKDLHLKKYEWLIRRVKQAKDPKNDKYDPQILIGIKIMEERSSRCVVYTYGIAAESINLPIPEKKAMGFGKTNLIKFPHYMTEEERLKWGTEHRFLFNSPERKPSKFYMRWQPDVKVGNELSIKLEDLKARLNGDED